MAGLLKYFKYKRDSTVSPSASLPEPNGSLKKKVPSKAIELANAEVTKLKETRPGGRGPYVYLTGAQRYQVGKRAAEYGSTNAMRYFEKTYPNFPQLKETTVRRLKGLYTANLLQPAPPKKPDTDDSDEDEDAKAMSSTVKELPRKKTGRPLLIGEELDAQVQQYVKNARKRGLAINTSVVIAAGEGIVMAHDANLLAENGGEIKLTDEWAKNVLKRMGYVKRKACSKAKVDPEHFEKLKEDFLLEIKSIVSIDEIPDELILNFDQTALNYVPVTPWTMEEEGAKRVEILAKDDKRQITAVFCGSMTGDFLPLQLIYEGKTNRCLPQFDFPSAWHVTHSDNHWSNEITMKQYFEKIILPYVNEKRKELQLSSDHPALLIFDNFKAQTTSSILKLLDSHKLDIVLLPANCTDRLQPLDLSVNKSAKDFLRSQFQSWYAKKLHAQLQEQSTEVIPIDLKLSAMKPLSAQWMESMFLYFKNNPSIVRNGFKEAGIVNCLST